MVAVPDRDTAFVEQKDGFNILHMFCDVHTIEGQTFDQYPRAVIRAAHAALRNSGIGDDAKMLVELEFYVFEKVHFSTAADHSYYSVESAEGLGNEYRDPPRIGQSQGYHRMAPEDRYQLLRNRAVKTMIDAGIPVKYHHHEVAISQLEIELDFVSMVHAADMVSIAKWILHNEADELGLKVTFMPKPMYGMAGSGMHIHQFIEMEGSSIFPGEDLYGLSKFGLSYTAGLLSHALSGSLLAFSNPSTNSYRRLVPGFEAPVDATFAQARGLRQCESLATWVKGRRASNLELAMRLRIFIIFLPQ